MICETIKAGMECAFMTPKGCGYNGGKCYPIVEQCEGCQRVVELDSGKYCLSYPNPAIKWKTGYCNFATHVKFETYRQQQEKLNPLKASKRAARKR